MIQSRIMGWPLNDEQESALKWAKNADWDLDKIQRWVHQGLQFKQVGADSRVPVDPDEVQS